MEHPIQAKKADCRVPLVLHPTSLEEEREGGRKGGKEGGREEVV